ncbi:MAG: hypothetical protein FJZ92_00755 [Chloroflexi bacterium]|nr:hypothetical protein [Chloroflexota bacterium]
MAGAVRLLVGTKNGAFNYTADAARQRWSISKPAGRRRDAQDADRLNGRIGSGARRASASSAPTTAASAGKTWPPVCRRSGFAIAVSQCEPDAVYVVPLEFERENFRACPGQLAVYRTLDGGTNWERLTAGLPGPHDSQSFCREGLATDGLDPEGVYVGTSNGEL